MGWVAEVGHRLGALHGPVPCMALGVLLGAGLHIGCLGLVWSQRGARGLPPGEPALRCRLIFQTQPQALHGSGCGARWLARCGFTAAARGQQQEQMGSLVQSQRLSASRSAHQAAASPPLPNSLWGFPALSCQPASQPASQLLRMVGRPRARGLVKTPPVAVVSSKGSETNIATYSLRQPSRGRQGHRQAVVLVASVALPLVEVVLVLMLGSGGLACWLGVLQVAVVVVYTSSSSCCVAVATVVRGGIESANACGSGRGRGHEGSSAACRRQP
ncbi:hypothetical protein V8C86DRAFT_533438 [Haematococcus lacustris]